MASLRQDLQDSPDVTRPQADAARVHRLRRAILVLGALAVVFALAFPIAPVHQRRVDYGWSASSGATATAIPLMPYQPISLSATVPCQAAVAAPPDGIVLSTVPLKPEPDAPLFQGLRVEMVGGLLHFLSYGHPIADDRPPTTDCDYQVRSDPQRTVVARDGVQIGAVQGDVRPVVTGVFTEEPGQPGLHMSMRADTRDETSATRLKVALALLFVACVLGALYTVRRVDRIERGAAPRLLPRAWWRPRLVDGAVIAGLVLWLLIGAITVDDGWILSMVRGVSTNGYIGNVYRWLNAPESPFSWFYQVYHWWAEVSTSTLWLRIPSTVIAICTWLVLSRGLLPRLGSFAQRRSTLWIAAVMFGGWWLPFNLGVRAEPWVALGTLAALVAVDRSVATGRLFPLLIGLIIAAATVTAAPQGLMAFTPVLVMLLPLVRMLRTRVQLRWLPALVMVVASSATGLLFAFFSQSYATMSEANRVRQLIGGGLPWYREIDRYNQLLTPENFQGALQRRVPVLLALFAIGWLAWMFTQRTDDDVARGPATVLAGTFGASLIALSFSPTKWTYHFGALAGIGAALLTLAVYAWSRKGIAAIAGQPPGMRVLWISAAGVGGIVLLGGLAFGGRNEWPFFPNFGVVWSTRAPKLFGHALATLAPPVAALLVAALALIAVLHVARGATEPPSLRWLPSPALLALLLVVGTIALQFGSLGQAAIKRRHTYTLAHDSIDILRRGSCGLADYLRVEPDPVAGLLTAVPNSEPARLDAFALQSSAARMAGMDLPGWKSNAAFNGAGDRPATAQTGWFALPQSLRSGSVPLVVTVSGFLSGRNEVDAEFGRSGAGGVTSIARTVLVDVAGAPGARDLRVNVPSTAPGADAVRLFGVYGGTGDSLAFSLPRAPRVEPMARLVPPHSAPLLDWPVAFVFPCLNMASLNDGVAQLPQWRVAPPRFDNSGAITTDPAAGGPFATARNLVREQQVPVYFVGDMERDVVTLYRWDPLAAFGRPTVREGQQTVSGFRRPGRMTVPGLDPSS